MRIINVIYLLMFFKSHGLHNHQS